MTAPGLRGGRGARWGGSRIAMVQLVGPVPALCLWRDTISKDGESAYAASMRNAKPCERLSHRGSQTAALLNYACGGKLRNVQGAPVCT